MAARLRPSDDDIRRHGLVIVEMIAQIESMQRQIEETQKGFQIQLTRIAQLQADLDALRSAWDKKNAPYTGPDRRRKRR